MTESDYTTMKFLLKNTTASNSGPLMEILLNSYLNAYIGEESTFDIELLELLTRLSPARMENFLTNFYRIIPNKKIADQEIIDCLTSKFNEATHKSEDDKVAILRESRLFDYSLLYRPKIATWVVEQGYVVDFSQFPFHHNEISDSFIIHCRLSST